jgi:hypothetical protein
MSIMNVRPSLRRFSQKMGPIRCAETSVTDYHSTLHNIPEDRRCHQHRVTKCRHCPCSRYVPDYRVTETVLTGGVRDKCRTPVSVPVNFCVMWFEFSLCRNTDCQQLIL